MTKLIRYIPLFLFLAAALAALSCSRPSVTREKPLVAVTIPPQAFFVEKIAGDLVDVEVLVPPGSSPHSYEPKPSQMVALAETMLYFAIGIQLEKAWLDRLTRISPNMTVVHTDAGIAKIPMDETHAAGGNEADHHGHEHHAGLDPHIWLSPELVRKQAATMTAALCRMDSSNEDLFRRNDSIFSLEITRLQDSIAEILSKGGGNRSFMVFHPAWGYFAREFGLTEYAIEVQGQEPSPRELAAIADLARRKRISTIFVQPQHSTRTAGIIAREIGARIKTADNLAKSWDSTLVAFARNLRSR